MRHLRTLAFAAALVAPSTALAADFTVGVTTDTGGLFRWSVNGVIDPPLTLTRGKTYTFAVTAPLHPFDIKTAPVTGQASQFTNGVTGEGVTNGTLTFVVPTDPSVTSLFYQCEVHGTMSGTIPLVSQVPASGPLPLLALAVGLGGAGILVARQRRRQF
jgi:hypothetical protein